MNKQLLTYKDAAKLLDVCDRTVWALVQRGDIPVVRFGRTVRIDPVDLSNFIERAKKRGVNDDE